jgi:hypothetical protein
VVTFLARDDPEPVMLQFNAASRRMECMAGAMMWGVGAVALLVVAALILAVAALAKYVFAG